ncbi:hypothetical protein ACN47E_004058 [Coniothyrium glycines]
MNEASVNGNGISESLPKRQSQEAEEHHRKRAKYTTAACNQCKRSKSKCIRLSESESKCQRCTTMKVACIVVPTANQSAKDKDKEKRKSTVDESLIKQLSNDISSLKDQVGSLTATVKLLTEKPYQPISEGETRTPVPQSASPTYTTTTVQRHKEPRKPLFVGPTRSDFSFNIAENALTRMATNENTAAGPFFDVTSPERSPSPSRDPDTPAVAGDPMLNITDQEALRLVGIYEDEIACVHPIIETKELVTNMPMVLDLLRKADYNCNRLPLAYKRDVLILKLAIATAIICETHGKNDLSDSLASSVEQDCGNVSGHGELDLKEVQISGMMSLYFCHASEELFAWRAIGKAARQCLEMGLHRRQSLFDNFKEGEHRNLAVQVFWVVYELDRRWSFGTSLSFALNDRDIDPQLPEPGKSNPYLKCMVAYARLCSRVWDALPPYGSPMQLMSKETEDYLDFVTQNWLLSIPDELQFQHPRLDLPPTDEPQQLRRLRTMLYLRGNFMRTLIFRHHVLTAENIRSSMQSAQQVVDIAKDTIKVLVHLNATSDIYIREQSIYHYYLLGALAVVLLAVCHAPNVFAETCRDPFLSAVELVKGFSRHSTASHRLWKSVRGLLPVVKSLGLRAEASRREQQSNEHRVRLELERGLRPQNSFMEEAIPANSIATGTSDVWTGDGSTFGATFESLPDIFDMSNDLVDLYDVFGAAGTDSQQGAKTADDNYGEQGFSVWELDEVSRHFHGLL